MRGGYNAVMENPVPINEDTRTTSRLRGLLPAIGRRIRIAVIALIATVIIGTAGYMLVERWSFLDALFMTVITLTTVGYGEVRPLSTGGRVFTIGLIFIGVSAAAYAASTLFETFIEQQFFGNILQERRMIRDIEHMQDHYIVCGFGRVGRNVVQELAGNHCPLVVVEGHPESAEAARAAGYLTVEGDATRDSVLLQAGVKRAKGVVSAVDTDTANLFIVVSCRALNEDLHIVARVSEEEIESKFLRAGADRVLCPYSLTGRRLAAMASAPNITDVLDMLVNPDYNGLALEEVQITAQSSLAGRNTGDAFIRRETGATVIAVKRGETITANPPEDTRIGAGDFVVAFGTREQLTRFLDLATTKATDTGTAAASGAADHR